MTMLPFQNQNCDLTLEQGIETYRAYLRANGKHLLVDPPGSTIVRDHDATHVIFGLDTSFEQESLLDTWTLAGTNWTWKELLAYSKLPELKELYKYLIKEIGIFRMLLVAFKLIPIKLKIRRYAKKMHKKWPFAFSDSLMSQRVSDLREEYGVEILNPQERVIKKPIIWSGSILD